jgi:hypothetical protein
MTMGDIKVEQYKSGVTRAVERWATKLKVIGGKAQVHRDALKKLEALSAPSADDKKKMAEHRTGLDKLTKEVDKATTELKLDIALLEIPKDAPKADLVKLPDWLKGIVKAKGIPLGKGVSIAPDVKFDLDKRKLTYVGVKVKW